MSPLKLIQEKNIFQNDDKRKLRMFAVSKRRHLTDTARKCLPDIQAGSEEAFQLYGSCLENMSPQGSVCLSP